MSKKIACTKCQYITEDEKHQFCTRCGSPLLNRCTDTPGISRRHCCGAINENNALYCYKCGQPTLFYVKGIIR